MAKAIRCKLRLHGSYKEILTSEFESIKEAKKWVSVCWNRPYTIVRLKETFVESKKYPYLYIINQSL